MRVAPIMALPSVLAGFGVDASRLLREFKLSPSAFGDPENRIAYSTVGHIFGRCVEATSCEHFGLLVGERAGISSLGAVGYLAQSAPNVRTALHTLQRLYHIADGGGTITLDHHGGSVSFGYAIVEPDVPNAEQLIAAAVAIGFNILRALCGPQWHPTEVHFALAEPPATARIRTAFHVVPRFDHARSGITFPARWLARPPPGADPILHRMMRERVTELLAGASVDDDVVGRVRRHLRTMATTPHCSIEVASEHLGLHVRTLKRRLAAAGTTFLELREEALTLRAICCEAPGCPLARSHRPWATPNAARSRVRSDGGQAWVLPSGGAGAGGRRLPEHPEVARVESVAAALA